MEFSDKPAIYNEFLEIMKNFKAHEYVPSFLLLLICFLVFALADPFVFCRTFQNSPTGSTRPA